MRVKYIFIQKKSYGPAGRLSISAATQNEASYIFTFDENWNIECIKDRDEKYYGINPMKYPDEINFSRKQRRFLCKILIERNTNEDLQAAVNDFVLDKICVNLLRGCYDIDDRLRYQIIRNYTIHNLNYNDILL